MDLCPNDRSIRALLASIVDEGAAAAKAKKRVSRAMLSALSSGDQEMLVDERGAEKRKKLRKRKGMKQGIVRSPNSDSLLDDLLREDDFLPPIPLSDNTADSREAGCLESLLAIVTKAIETVFPSLFRSEETKDHS
mmetsp:Transcript_25391/g.63671  ORF Transcript_25391/g.63671 Transcript_25391/m.63671 type:complete len:136 (+) Transcript_25391:1217-1624(+)